MSRTHFQRVPDIKNPDIKLNKRAEDENVTF